MAVFAPPLAPNPNTGTTTFAPTAASASTSAVASTSAATRSVHAGTSSQDQTPNATDDEAGKKKKTTKRRKVNHACLYCRRSHMTCDEGRPCQRCIKREIGHLCHDERRPPKAATPSASTPGTPGVGLVSPTGVGVGVGVGMNFSAMGLNTMDLSRAYAPSPHAYQPNPAWPLTAATPTHPANLSAPTSNGFMYAETLGNEFAVLTDFLETLDEGMFFSPPTSVAPTLMSSQPYTTASYTTDPNSTNAAATATTTTAANSVSASAEASSCSSSSATPQADPHPGGGAVSTDVILPAATKTEKFLLTAADQESGSRDERLNRVIRSKYEAGLLKPYNYVKGYARLSRWMDRNVSQESKQQILQPLSVLRPKFRAVAQSLRDIDLVFIEEAFERMLLDYDRVFSAMGVPACLWRRTGEIYKGNREFSELVGIDGYLLREGRLCIYELMAEESAVNYWEKYGHVAFDSTQKAVLTSCVLRYKPVLSSTTPNTNTTSGSSISGVLASGSSGGGGALVKKEEEEVKAPPGPMEEGFISCCFSFTIRRDKWGIPSMIVGNFIKC
ncbi:hypothetical protein BDN72DRAFT_920203 [Pluteus cervinus]|uniref:Uncharacterized protein n=1 Tax=Pluteus cervinus TaxID=181527 RepID=A0ACD3AJB6_9AGAR|nr:hypothetical protein BDN72DRAFT_920203 [Pluteus cervinus]